MTTSARKQYRVVRADVVIGPYGFCISPRSDTGRGRHRTIISALVRKCLQALPAP